MNKTVVPFLDLITPHAQLEQELVAAFQRALATAGFIGGPTVEKFEREFAEFCRARYCVGVGNGTDALRFALQAAGVAPGDAVITVPNTFIATTEAISQVGAGPEFVDVDETTSNMDVAKLQDYLENQCDLDKLTGKLVSRKSGRSVTAVVPVHLYGQTADMDPILELAAKYGLLVIEDACQAHGAQYYSQKDKAWKTAGTMGVAAAFSFYPGKNLGACGEAGAVTTNDEVIARKIRMIRDHGQAKKYYHAMEGYNGRLDSIQAAFLSVKLPYLAPGNEKRQEAAQRYRELLNQYSESIGIPAEMNWAKAVYHLFVIRSKNRDQLRAHLAEVGVDTGIHYPIPLHLQDAYRDLGYKKGDFPVAEQLAEEILSLPMFPGLSPEQQAKVAAGIANFVSVAV